MASQRQGLSVMDVEWDEEKNSQNKEKHKLSFETAQGIFNDKRRIERLDKADDEDRIVTIGMIGGVCVLACYTIREYETHERYRLISARKADKQERKSYEAQRFLRT
ncbi:BrnT family toxin [Uliginosibacterium sediminicola]|uniref:BrnT family toxin n=1 Tax=Uliginosibacterium sediminicola TaxID=2024550 RepID=A0ABU9Z1Z9_9RHOO